MTIRLSTLTPSAPERTPDAGPAEAARGMEAMFLRHLLTELRKGQEGGLLEGGTAGRMFREMLDAALADTMANAGGIGLGATLETQLTGSAEGTAVVPATTALRHYGKQPAEIKGKQK